MNSITSAIKLYQKAFVQSFKYFINNSIFMIVGAVMIIAIIAIHFLTAPLPLFGYLIRAIAESACFSSYLYIITRASLGYNVDWDDVKTGLYVHTRVILGVIILNNFILIVLVQFLFVPLPVIFVYLLALAFFINALPEVISNKGYYVIDSIKYTFEFEKRNVLLWYIPNIIVILIFVLLQSFLSIGIYAFGGNISIKLAAVIIVLLLIFQFVGAILMLFRQLLFRILDSGEYKRRFHVVK